MPAATAAGHRLVLSGPEWVLLCRVTTMTPPPGFAPAGEATEQQLHAAADTLVERGLLVNAEQLRPSVMANLGIWADPAALVRAELGLGERSLRAAYVVRGPLGSSLFTMDGGGVELSMFPAVALGRELVRCVPDPMSLQGPAAKAVHAGLEYDPARARPLRGQLPLAALADGGLPADAADAADLATSLPLTDRQTELAAELAARTVGVLHCLAVEGRRSSAAGPERAAPALVGDVLWLLTTTGWVGLRPDPDGSGRQLVDVVAVRHEDIGSWLAPHLARILDGAGT